MGPLSEADIALLEKDVFVDYIERDYQRKAHARIYFTPSLAMLVEKGDPREGHGGFASEADLRRRLGEYLHKVADYFEGK